MEFQNSQHDFCIVIQKKSPIAPLTLEWIPATMRARMDQAKVRISLAQWQMLPMPERETLAHLANDASTSHASFVRVLQTALMIAGAGPARADRAS